MHKRIVLLIQASNNEEAEDKAKDFLEPYGNGQVWDWYVIGGRWSGVLSEAKFDRDKLKDLNKRFGDEHGWYTSAGKSEQVQQIAYAKMFEECFPDWRSKVPAPLNWRDEYREGGYSDDIMKLSECIEVVREFKQDPITAGVEEETHAKKQYGAKEGENPDYGMYGYCLTKAGKLYQQEFCFDCNVFNIEQYDYSTPEDTEGWWAVMIDIHN